MTITPTKELSKTTQLLLNTVRELQLPFKFREDFGGIEIKFGKKRYFFCSGASPFNTASNHVLGINKFLANEVLHQAGLPVPHHVAIAKRDFTEHNWWFLHKIKYPIVAKPPLHTSTGDDVFCGIRDEKTLIRYLEKTFQRHQFMSLETFHSGLVSYRVLIFFGKVIGVVRRDPAYVIGDGVNTIAELIRLKNIIREEYKQMSSGLMDYEDPEMAVLLQQAGLTFYSVPAAGQHVALCYRCNSTCGGEVVSLGTEICPENAKMLCKAAKLLGLNYVGFDFLCEDINIPYTRSRAYIIEANSHADLTIHEYPNQGVKVRAQKTVLKKLIYRHPVRYVWWRLTRHLPPALKNYRWWLAVAAMLGLIWVFR